MKFLACKLAARSSHRAHDAVRGPGLAAFSTGTRSAEPTSISPVPIRPFPFFVFIPA